MAEATAIIVGVGPGLGAALARRFAAAGMAVAVAARDPIKLGPIVNGIATGKARAYACDATSERQVQQLFAAVTQDLGAPDLVVFNASGRVRKSLLEIGVEEFERAWRNACLGGFIVGREAARAMLPRGRGKILFTGATASVKGFSGSAGFAVGKFGLRGLAQSMARELHPQGIHVAHIVVDGGIASPSRPQDAAKPEALLEPDAIAQVYYDLYCQPRSAWTHEIDLRPWVERF
ncbi:MAG: SDR family NAD(P)-dependent oxidoreductase [Alphaproteobacteria bacterium]|nr:SDR family NAD(P)-dependent oxidoreductase [Alphaproteobacteria bacterium]